MPAVRSATPPLLTDPDPTALYGLPGSDHELFGSAKLTAGTVTVANKKITAGALIFVSGQDGSVTGILTVTRTAGTSFTITSSVAGDTGFVAYAIILV